MWVMLSTSCGHEFFQIKQRDSRSHAREAVKELPKLTIFDL